MPHTPKEFVGRALELLENDLRSHLLARGCPATRSKASDAKALLGYMLDSLDLLFPNPSEQNKKAEARTYVHELRGFRNKWAHSEELSADDAQRAADTLARLCRVLGCDDKAAVDLKQLIRMTEIHGDALLEDQPTRQPTRMVGFSVVNVVACGKTKLSRPAKAADLYVGSIFTNSIAEARKDGLPFVIFSSKFGLVQPDDVLGPYDVSLSTMTADEKAVLAQLIQQQVRPLVAGGLHKMFVLGGNEFFYLLCSTLRGLDVIVEKHPKWPEVKRKVFPR